MTDRLAASCAGVFGYRIESELPLSRLRCGAMPRGRIVVGRASRELLDEPAEIIQLVEHPGEAGIGFAIARTAQSVLAWCADTGAYRVDAARGQICAQGSGDAEGWEDRLLNALIPLLLIERGELMLHAAAVLTDAGAVVVCGPSGRGKSTLAAALGAQGLPVLAEDATALALAEDEVLLWPGPTGVRLDMATTAALGPQSGDALLVRGKHMHVFPTSIETAAPVPVAAVVRLERRGGSRLSITRLPDTEAMVGVFPSVYRLELETWPSAFSRAAELVRRVPCYTARLPDDLLGVPRAALALLEHVTSGVSQLKAA